jgi:hypothetical protein
MVRWQNISQNQEDAGVLAKSRLRKVPNSCAIYE